MTERLSAEELHKRETDRLESRLWANDDGPSLAGYRQLAFDAISLLKDSTYAAIEAEATAAAEQRLREAAIVIAAARALVDSWYGGEEGPRYLELRDALNVLDSGALDVPDEPMRAHIVIGAVTPRTEAGRLWHAEWHSGEYPNAPTECGSMGCGFLGRILALEAAALSEPAEAGEP